MTLIIPAGSFLSKVVSFFLGPWGKLVGILLLCGALAWGFRLWLNKHDDRIFQQGKDRQAELMQKDYESRLKVGLAEAKAMADTAAADRAAVEAALKKIDARFVTVFYSLDQISADVKKRDVVYVEKTNSIPASELAGAVRALSDAIARQWPVR